MTDTTKSDTTKFACPPAGQPEDRQPLRLGLIAPEFPPDLGGMAELSRGMANALALTDDVVVYCHPGRGLPEADFEQKPVLSDNLRRDAELLSGDRVDAWLALNAGLVPLARVVERPFFAYFMGNDFLDPWIPYGGAWERFQRPYLAPLRHALRRLAMRRSASSLRGLLTISRRSAELIEACLGIERRRIQIQPPGVDQAFFQQTRRDDTHHLRVLTVSRLSSHTPRQNIDVVLQAVAPLAPRFPIHYTVVGDGDDLPRLQGLARQLGLDSQVHFRGAVDKQQLLACYAAADLFVLAAKASEKDVEGFGIVYLEASASGVPVIASVEGGATDAVEEGRNGLLIPGSSAREIAQGIEHFRARRDSFPPARVRAFAEQFRWPAVAAEVRRIIVSRL